MAIKTTDSFQPFFLTSCKWKAELALGFCLQNSSYREGNLLRTPPHPKLLSINFSRITASTVTMLVSYKETELDLAESSPLSWVAIVQNTLGGKQRRPYSLHCTAENLRFREAQWNRGAVDAGKAWTSFFYKASFQGNIFLSPSLHHRCPSPDPKPKEQGLERKYMSPLPPTVCTAFII